MCQFINVARYCVFSALLIYSLPGQAGGASGVVKLWDIIVIKPPCRANCVPPPKPPGSEIPSRKELIKIIKNANSSNVNDPKQIFSVTADIKDPFKRMEQKQYSKIFIESYEVFRGNEITKKDALMLLNEFGYYDSQSMLESRFKDEFDKYSELYKRSKHKMFRRWELEPILKVDENITTKMTDACQKAEFRRRIKADLKNLDNRLHTFARLHYSGYMAFVESHIKKELEAYLTKHFISSIEKLLPEAARKYAVWGLKNIKVAENNATVDIGAACGYQLSMEIKGYNFHKSSINLVVTPEGVPLLTPHLNRYIRDRIKGSNAYLEWHNPLHLAAGL